MANGVNSAQLIPCSIWDSNSKPSPEQPQTKVGVMQARARPRPSHIPTVCLIKVFMGHFSPMLGMSHDPIGLVRPVLSGQLAGPMSLYVNLCIVC